MHIQTPSTWGKRIATLALVSTLSVAATIAVMPLKPVAAQGAGKSVTTVSLPVGHHQMTETPDATLFAIRDFLAR